MSDAKRNAAISVGKWWLNADDLTLNHVTGYWVGAEENLNDAELLHWVRNLNAPVYGPLTSQDFDDFVKLAQLVQRVDLKKLKAGVRISGRPVQKVLTKAAAELREKPKGQLIVFPAREISTGV